MQGQVKSAKIVFSDGGVDKGISGVITGEDDFFINFSGSNGKNYRIGKKAIISIEELR